MNEWQEEINHFNQSQQKKDNRLRSLYREMNRMWVDFKHKRQQSFEEALNRKADEEDNRRVKIDQMMQKLQRSEKAVEDYMKEQKHEIMLKQELRKLREDDMKKLR